MRNLLKGIYAWVGISAMLVVSCQHEENQTQQNPNALSKNSALTTGLLRVAMNNTSIDNFIDHTSAFSIKFPYVMVANGQAVSVNSTADYQTVRNIFDVSASDVDTVAFTFPLTLSNYNYTEVVVNNAQEYQQYRDNTQEPSNPPVPCFRASYPISISVYDSNLQNAQTRSINSNSELFGFVSQLSAGQFYQVNYPMNAIDSNGASVTISSNAQLANAINAAANTCSCTNPNVLTDDLVMYIPFGNELHDLTGNSELLISGNYHYVTDRSGNANGAISMDDGTNNGQNTIFAEGNAANNMMQNGSFTMSFWYKRQDNSGANIHEELTSNFAFSVLTGSPLIGSNMQPYLTDMSDDIIYDDSWVTEGLGNDIANWHHLTVSYDAGSNQGKLYRDGQLRRTFTCNDMPSSIPSYTFANRYKGFMDDIRVYKKALTGAQVQILYNLEGDVNQCMN
jgi:hypothetical protein